MIVTRFAPSPNGPLHWGHAYSAIVAHDLARGSDGGAGGKFLLRIEDIDGPRSQPELAEEFRRDLEWLGLEWNEVPAQGTRLARYEEALAALDALGVLYPCTCTRADIAAAASEIGPEGPIYPGTCRLRGPSAGAPAALRLDWAKALEITGPLSWEDDAAGDQPVAQAAPGDPVLRRKDLPASYHLAVTVDDAADGVTLVTRGRDLFHATPVHRVLQALLDLPVPRWHHHPLLLDPEGRKLAKRRGSPAIADYRTAGEDGRAWADRLRDRAWPTGISLQKAHI
ncbi:MAG: tRNA glutamyl-Q(34) synthetase GluQRS [Erythrobacter sp.]|nr:tRNA glutamyl-Q(34) synthetase GluQRS [Erythrobacter sp.]NCQ63542.1 tRNA glutamyl-Q(34) synthetase GluQRS [Alphaproteobacteria bacterium]